MALYGQYLPSTHGGAMPQANLKGLSRYKCACPACQALPVIYGHRPWANLPEPSAPIAPPVWPAKSAKCVSPAQPPQWEVDEERDAEIVGGGKTRGQASLGRQMEMQGMLDAQDLDAEIIHAMADGRGG